jgi:hypothetical protein
LAVPLIGTASSHRGQNTRPLAAGTGTGALQYGQETVSAILHREERGRL